MAGKSKQSSHKIEKGMSKTQAFAAILAEAEVVRLRKKKTHADLLAEAEVVRLRAKTPWAVGIGIAKPT